MVAVHQATKSITISHCHRLQAALLFICSSTAPSQGLPCNCKKPALRQVLKFFQVPNLNIVIRHKMSMAIQPVSLSHLTWPSSSQSISFFALIVSKSSWQHRTISCAQEEELVRPT
mmetsp:Transcript_18421/g.40045  ORF Transcript_18421/g.40045 Transcript_18421/m.40045 type:complete len:116 (+) Transcript_18421:443-790(+)